MYMEEEMFTIPFELQQKYPNKYFLTTIIYKRATAIQKSHKIPAQKAINRAINELINDKLIINVLSNDEFKIKQAEKILNKKM